MSLNCNNTPVSASVSAMTDQAATEGGALLSVIGKTTRALTDLMREAHGGSWRFEIDHETHFIVIRMQPDIACCTPTRGEAV